MQIIIIIIIIHKNSTDDVKSSLSALRTTWNSAPTELARKGTTEPLNK